MTQEEVSNKLLSLLESIATQIPSRDQYAMAALNAIMMRSPGPYPENKDEVVYQSFEIADMMVAYSDKVEG